MTRPASAPFLACLLLFACVGCGPPLEPREQAGLKIERKPGEAFASLARSTDATPYRGKTIVLSARLRSDNVPNGPNGVWVRTDGPDGKMLGFAASYAHSLTGTTEWSSRMAALDVDESAQSIVYGAMLSSDGTLWVDGLGLKALDGASVEPPSPAASAYLDDALAAIRRRAYYSDRVDWAHARSGAFALASGAKTPGETYDAIQYVLRLLGDHHSHLVEPAAARDDRESKARDFHIAGSLVSGAGYVAIPGYNGQDPERSKAFQREIEGHILAAQAGGHSCGWVIDLREDTGGNMWPMLQGLHAFLGDNTIGYFTNRGGEWIPWSISTIGSASDADGLKRTDDFVAVITGPHTASAGEAVAIALRGRPNTRSFGEPTAGLSTANSTIALPDGARLAVTTGLMADRNRDIAVGKIRADELVALPTNLTPLPDDPAVKAALAWLGSSCRG